jgi:hypothetical protein
MNGKMHRETRGSETEARVFEEALSALYDGPRGEQGRNVHPERSAILR